jgi:5'-nucleotidase
MHEEWSLPTNRKSPARVPFADAQDKPALLAAVPVTLRVAAADNIARDMTHILLTNDDGIQAVGLRTLRDAMEGLGTISIVAPSREQSGAAQSLTLRQPIVCHEVAEREWAIDGTPADCVIVALHKLLPEPPDIVISGINYGANLGENAYYSGTVGAAREAALHHIPAVAMSLCSKKSGVDFKPSARIARTAAELVLSEKLPDQVLLNINVPEPWNGGVRFTRQSKKITRNQLSEGKDPRGRLYFWLFEQRINSDVAKDSDYAAIFAGDVSITPLHLDPTDDKALRTLAGWAEKIGQKDEVKK